MNRNFVNILTSFAGACELSGTLETNLLRTSVASQPFQLKQHGIHSLKRKGSITDKQLKYFLNNYKNATNLGKLYLLPKFINVYLMFQEDPSFPIVRPLLEGHLSFLNII